MHGRSSFGPASWIGLLRWVNACVGIFVAGYTAFLFKQCKGRDLWEASGLLWHLLAQSVTAAAATFLLFGVGGIVSAVALGTGVLALFVLHYLPVKKVDQTANYRQASAFLHEARVGGATVVGLSTVVVPILGLLTAGLYLGVPDERRAALTLVGGALSVVILAILFLYERAFVRAGQLPPLS